MSLLRRLRITDINQFEQAGNVNGLVKALRHRDESIRFQAAKALREIRLSEYRERTQKREAVRKTRIEERSKIRPKTESEFPWKPMPRSIQVIQHDVMYGEAYDVESSMQALDRWMDENRKPQEPQFEKQILNAEKQLAEQWRTQEEEWRNEDEEWRRENERLGMGNIQLPEAEGPSYRCPDCGADTKGKKSALWGRGVVCHCPYCLADLSDANGR